jgi:hypothetical protein
VKKNKSEDLELQWPHRQASQSGKSDRPRKENTMHPLDEYFDFLGEIGPLSPDRTPSKIYKQLFTKNYLQTISAYKFIT